MGHDEEHSRKIEKNGTKYLVTKSRCKDGDEVKVTIKIKKEKSKSSKDRTGNRPNGNEKDNPVFRSGSWGDLLMRKKAASESSGGNGDCHKENHTQHSRVEQGVYLQLTEEQRTKRRPKLLSRGRSGDRNRNFESAEDYIDKYCSQDASHVAKHAVDGDSVLIGRCCESCTGCSRPNRESDGETRKDAGTSMRMSYVRQTSQVVQSTEVRNGNDVQASRFAPDRTNKKLDTVVEEEDSARRMSMENRRVYAEAIDTARRRLEELERENLMLKSDAEKLHEEVDKATKERGEYMNTLKDLYELADILRHENGLLHDTHDEYKQLQNRFEDLLGENQLLRQYVEEVTTSKMAKGKRQSNGETAAKNNSSNDNQLQEFLKVLDTLKEVKTVIADEIQGFHKASLSKMDLSNRVDLQELLKKSNMNRSAASNINDSNIQCDDEIQEIFRGCNLRNDPVRSEVRSSTQYLDVEDLDAFEHIRRFVPSPDGMLSD